MYYILYLSSLCRRRRWSDPHYDCIPFHHGYTCVVRVNHREYYAEGVHPTEVLAREAAAQLAYQFSVNESQVPMLIGAMKSSALHAHPIAYTASVGM